MTKKALKNQQKEAREIVKQIFNLALAINFKLYPEEDDGRKTNCVCWF